MTQLDKEYDRVLRKILDQGVDDNDRTGTGTRKIVGEQVQFEASAENFPIVTKKRIVWNSLWTELVWFIQGRTNVKFLQDHGVEIWNNWADEDGELGPSVYGKMWRDWNGTDQLQKAVDGLRNNPSSRRHVVSAWNVDYIPKTCLPPCHLLYQFVSKPQTDSNNRKLDIVITQRSADAPVGMVWNWSSYATLLLLIAKLTDHDPGEVIWNGGDIHIYKNQMEAVEKYLSLEKSYEPPRIEVEDIGSLDDIGHSTVELVDYQCGPFIKFPVAV